MVSSPFLRLASALILLAVFLQTAIFPVAPAAGRSDSRFERLLAGTDFSAAEKDAIGLAYRSALRAGSSRRDTLELLKVCLQGEFQTEQIARLLTIVAKLELEGLPAEAFRSKIREGVAKKVAPPDILVTAERGVTMMNRAARVFNQIVIEGVDIDHREDLLPAMAEALEKGRSEHEISRIIRKVLAGGGRVRDVRRALLR